MLFAINRYRVIVTGMIDGCFRGCYIFIFLTLYHKVDYNLDI